MAKATPQKIAKEFNELLDATIKAAEQYGRNMESKELANQYHIGALSNLKVKKSRLKRFVNKNFFVKKVTIRIKKVKE